MKNREETVKFIKDQLNTAEYDERKKRRHHYGKWELRDLLDFIYENTPTTSKEKI